MVRSLAVATSPFSVLRRTDGELIAAAACAALCLVALVVWGGLVVGAPAGEHLSLTEVVSQAEPSLLGVPLAVAALALMTRQGAGLRATGWLWLTVGAGAIALSPAKFVIGTGFGGRAAALAMTVVALLGYTAHQMVLYLLPLWFPDGRLPNRWWRLWVAAVVVWALPQSYQLLATRPARAAVHLAVPPAWWRSSGQWLEDHLAHVQDQTAIPIVVVALLVFAVRWWGAAWQSRRIGLLLLVPYLIFTGTVFAADIVPSNTWSPRADSATALAWALVLGVVVARGKVWHIDRATQRVVIGYLLVFLLSAVYIAIVVTLSQVLNAEHAAAVLAGLAFVVGVTLRPAVAWVDRSIDRAYFGHRARPYEVVKALSERLSRQVQPNETPAAVCRTIVVALRLPGAALGVCTRTGLRQLALSGELTGRQTDFAIRYHGAVIGQLSVQPREGEAGLDAADAEILTFLADQVAPAIASLQLLQDLQSSREQIVIAREEERRRLRRDIHDGIGPTLAGMRLRIDAACSNLPAEAPAAVALHEISGWITETITDIRRITDGLGPAALGELGLTGGLRQIARGMDGPALRVFVALEPDPLPPLPAAVEVAAYRIAAEALANVVKHAHASHARVALTARADAVTLTIEDDGVGFHSSGGAAGIGLRSMAERAAEIGGRCVVGSAGERGARVRVELPRGARPLGPPASNTPLP